MRLITRSRMLLAAAGAVTMFLSPPASASTRSAPVTVRIFVAPVTASGHAAQGFTVKGQHGLSVMCEPGDPSPVSVSKNVDECSPSAAYAVACWKAATAGRVLCMRDPRSHEIDSMKLSGRFATTAPVSARELAPFVIVLADGTVCSIRDGGAWGTLKGHPDLYGSYSCTRHGVVWTRYDGHTNQAHNGVNESTPIWTVRTSPGGAKPLVVRHVLRAYFVATANG